MRMRRYRRRHEDGTSQKDTMYPSLQLCIVNPCSGVVVKASGRDRYVWSEFALHGIGPWHVFAFCNDGSGGSFSLRVYTTDCTIRFQKFKSVHGMCSDANDLSKPRLAELVPFL